MEDITRSLAEQHIKEYDLRLARLDSLFARAEGKVEQSAAPAENRAELDRLREERHMLARWLAESRARPPEHWREDEIRKAGPMGVWDAVAQQLEALIERLERT